MPGAPGQDGPPGPLVSILSPYVSHRSLQKHHQKISLLTFESLNILLKSGAEYINELYAYECTDFLSAQQELFNALLQLDFGFSES